MADANLQAATVTSPSPEARAALEEYEDYRRRALACTDPKAASELTADAARDLAPGQIRQIYCDIDAAGDPALTALFRAHGQLWNLLIRREPPAFDTLRLAAGARLFRAQGVSRAKKVLLVVFSGVGGGAFISTARLLMRLPVGRFDVLWLNPAEGSDYPHGVPGFGNSLYNVCRSVSRFMPGYGGVAAFGGSLGAYSALRAAVLLDLAVGVSLSGRFSQLKWRNGQREAAAYDPLCACQRPGRTALIAFHCAGHRLDTRQARRLKAMRPSLTLVPLKTETHNALAAMMAEGSFDILFEDIYRRATADTSRPFYDWQADRPSEAEAPDEAAAPAPRRGAEGGLLAQVMGRLRQAFRRAPTGSRPSDAKGRGGLPARNSAYPGATVMVRRSERAAPAAVKAGRGKRR